MILQKVKSNSSDELSRAVWVKILKKFFFFFALCLLQQSAIHLSHLTKEVTSHLVNEVDSNMPRFMFHVYLQLEYVFFYGCRMD